MFGCLGVECVLVVLSWVVYCCECYVVLVVSILFLFIFVFSFDVERCLFTDNCVWFSV